VHRGRCSRWYIWRATTGRIGFRQRHALDEDSQFRLGELLQPVQVIELRLRREGGLVEPVPLVRLFGARRAGPDGVAEFAVLNPVLTRENLNAVFEAAAFLPARRAVGRGYKYRCGTPPPRVASPRKIHRWPPRRRLFERGLDSILLSSQCNWKEGLDSAVKSASMATHFERCGLRIDRVEIDGDVAASGALRTHVGVERFWLLGLPVRAR